MIKTLKLFKELIKEALSAISVLPKPTSPHINLSIGLADDKSLKTSFKQVI